MSIGPLLTRRVDEAAVVALRGAMAKGPIMIIRLRIMPRLQGLDYHAMAAA